MKRADLQRKLSYRVARDPALRTARDLGRDLGTPVWVVGGLVRDTALGLASGDVDLVAGPGAARLVRGLQERWATGGYRFRKRGVTTWRFRVGVRDVDLVDASRRGIRRDMFRREFTINAVAFEITAGRLLDPAGGLADLRRGLLRLPRPGVLREDPLRAVRAARFLARFPGFRLHRGARAEAMEVARRAARASVERIRDELDKMLAAPAPADGLRALEDLDLLHRILPELVPMKTCVAGGGRPSVWEHTLDCMSHSASYRRRPASTAVRNDTEGLRVVRWSLLLHDIAKPETHVVRDDGRPTFHGHETLGAHRGASLMSRLLLPRALRRRVRRLVLNHLRPYQLADAGSPARGLRRLVRDAGEDLPLLVVHAVCDALGSGSPDAAARWRKLRRCCATLLRLHEERRLISPSALLSGREVMRILGIGPGPRIGEILNELRSLQEERTIVSRVDAIRHLEAKE